MGGSITVVIRKKDGTIIKCCRWTNSLPSFIGNLKFIEKDDEHLEKYLKTYYDMKRDWEANKDSGNFEFGMTSSYAAYNDILAPMSYGIVVIDYMKSHLLHMQGYARLDGFDKIEAEAGICQRKYYMNDGRDKDFQALWNAGKIDRYESWEKPKVAVYPINGLKDLKKLLKKDSYEMLLINMEPWTVIRYEETANGTDEIKAKILELGFYISEADDKEWAEFKTSCED